MQSIRKDHIHTRSDRKLPVELAVRYWTAREVGAGRTVEMGAWNVAFTTSTPLAVGQKVQVSIDWPVLLNGTTPLQLIASGFVVRAGAVAELHIEQRPEFRTRRTQ